MQEQLLFNTNNTFWVSTLPFSAPPFSSSFHLSLRIWPVFKWLRAQVKLDWVQCNEELARESYGIKCRTNTPKDIQALAKHTNRPMAPTPGDTIRPARVLDVLGRGQKIAYSLIVGFLNERHWFVQESLCSLKLAPLNWLTKGIQMKAGFYTSIDFPN